MGFWTCWHTEESLPTWPGRLVWKKMLLQMPFDCSLFRNVQVTLWLWTGPGNQYIYTGALVLWSFWHILESCIAVTFWNNCSFPNHFQRQTQIGIIFKSEYKVRITVDRTILNRRVYQPNHCCYLNIQNAADPATFFLISGCGFGFTGCITT